MEHTEYVQKRRALTEVSWRARVKPLAALVALLGLFALLMMIRLSDTPPLWWDEGWTMSVARNWVELGHYGRLLNGEPAPPGLNAALPITAPIALSLRLFGVGIWQARLVGVLFTLGALVLMYYLAGRLYDPSVAVGTLAVLLLMSGNVELHPVFMGRQVLAEMPMLFFLLGGYAFFLSAWQRPRWFLPLTVIFWGVGLETKAQPLPFWMASLLTPLLVMLCRRRWRPVGLLSISLLGSLVVSRQLEMVQQLILGGHVATNPPVRGLYGVTALVPVARIHWLALILSLTLGLPSLLGLGYATGTIIMRREQLDLSAGPGIVRLALLVLAGGWLAWYVLLSVGWSRYLFPATSISSMFVAGLLCDLTDHFSLSFVVKRSARVLKHFSWQNAGALLAVLLIVATVPLTLRSLYQFYAFQSDASVLQTANFLNTQTPHGALIETYESELFFLLDRPYHYPPDQIHVELNRRAFLDQDVPIDYDPLAADPEYLVVGGQSRFWGLYDGVLSTNHFGLVKTFGRYEVYQRQHRLSGSVSSR